MDPVATEKVVFVHPDGTRKPGAIRIGRPYLVADGEARCPVGIEGLYDNLRDPTGDSTLQALMLAARLCHILLSAFIERGGRVLYEGDDDLDLDLDALFGITPEGETTTMGTCTLCDQVMRATTGCSVSTITLDGTVFDRIPHGEGKTWGAATKRCSNCGGEPGRLHHAGCQYEECPKCGDAQMFACECEKEEGAPAD